MFTNFTSECKNAPDNTINRNDDEAQITMKRHENNREKKRKTNTI